MAPLKTKVMSEPDPVKGSDDVYDSIGEDFSKLHWPTAPKAKSQAPLVKASISSPPPAGVAPKASLKGNGPPSKAPPQGTDFTGNHPIDTAVHLCAGCSLPVDTVKGMLYHDYKELSSCGCVVHKKCIKADMSCANCICIVCDQGGVYVETGGISVSFESSVHYPKKIFACGDMFHQPCYNKLLAGEGHPQIEALKACGYKKCVLCIDSQFISSTHPDIMGPNYFKTHAERELALLRAGIPRLPKLQPKKVDPPKKVEPSREGFYREPAIRNQMKTSPGARMVLGQPLNSHVSPPEDRPPELTASQLLKRGPLVPASAMSSSGHTPSSDSFVQLGQRIYYSRMSLVDLINCGYTLEDFAAHMSAEAFFKRFFDVEILTTYLPRTPDTFQSDIGCSGDKLFSAWPTGVNLHDISSGIKGSLSKAPSTTHATRPEYRPTIEDLTRLGVTRKDVLDKGLMIEDVIVVKPLESWPSLWGDLDVKSIEGWYFHAKLLFDAKLITKEQLSEAALMYPSGKVISAISNAGSFVVSKLWRTGDPASAPTSSGPNPYSINSMGQHQTSSALLETGAMRTVSWGGKFIAIPASSGKASTSKGNGP